MCRDIRLPKVCALNFVKKLFRCQDYDFFAENCALKPNEEYFENTYDCQILCETVLAGPCQLLSLLPINDCFCKRGYARIAAGGLCVPVCSKRCLRKIKIPEPCPE